MKFFFHKDAEAEFESAIDYYEQSKPSLGFEFAEEVYSAIARINEYSEAWPVMSPNTRRCLISRFPFGLIYQVKDNTLRIIAVANLHRRPGYWKKRIK